MWHTNYGGGSHDVLYGVYIIKVLSLVKVKGFILYKVKPKHKRNSQRYMRILCCTPSHKLPLDAKLFCAYYNTQFPALTYLVKVFAALYFIICQSTFSRGLPTSGTYHSFHWYTQNAMIPGRSQELLPFLSVIYTFLPPFSTNYLPSSLTSSYHLFLGLPLSLVASKFIYNTFLGNSISFHSLYMSKPT